MGEMFIVKIHKMIQIDEHVFEMGWSDQLVTSINCQGIIDWNSFLLVSSSSLIRNVKFPETGSVGRQHQNGGLHQKQPTKWVGKNGGHSFIRDLVYPTERTQSYRNWRQTDDGCEELDGNPSSGHVYDGRNPGRTWWRWGRVAEVWRSCDQAMLITFR